MHRGDRGITGQFHFLGGGRTWGSSSDWPATDGGTGNQLTAVACAIFVLLP